MAGMTWFTLRRCSSRPLLSLLLAGLTTSAAGVETPACFSAPEVSDLLQRLNTLRAAGAVCGSTSMPPAHPLQWNEALAATARTQALDMAAHDRVSHESSDGRTLAQRLKDGGYRYAMAGENVAGGQRSVPAVLAAWLASPAHCTALLKAEFIDVGLACVPRRAGVYRTHWVLHLATPLLGARP
jgi:uncharacterized protein YkwD